MKKYITRFRAEIIPASRVALHADHLVEDRDGGFVRFSDYLKERQNLEHSVGNLQEILSGIAEITKEHRKKDGIANAVRRAIKAAR